MTTAPVFTSTDGLSKGRGETLLVAEDETDVLNLSKLQLEKLGYKVLTAGTHSEAVRLAREHADEIQLLITDVIMPEMNGRDLVRLLQQDNPRLKCLFISGYTSDVIAHSGVLDDGLHFLQKPYSVQDLAIKVRTALEQP